LYNPAVQTKKRGKFPSFLLQVKLVVSNKTYSLVFDFYQKQVATIIFIAGFFMRYIYFASRA